MQSEYCIGYEKTTVITKKREFTIRNEIGQGLSCQEKLVPRFKQVFKSGFPAHRLKEKRESMTIQPPAGGVFAIHENIPEKKGPVP